jgi:hypothetical protein
MEQPIINTTSDIYIRIYGGTSNHGLWTEGCVDVAHAVSMANQLGADKTHSDVAAGAWPIRMSLEQATCVQGL